MKAPAPARRDAALCAFLLLLIVASGLARPLLPIDETRYAAVAWEMWARGDFLVPHLNGEPYHHKPPLLFWLIHAGWLLFGVQEWWLRLIPPLFAAGTLALCALLARRLWPDRPAVAGMAPLILLANGLFAYFASALMFDVMLSFFVALGVYGLVRAWQDGGARGFALLALGLGGAFYAKGPVALVHLLPPALLAPWWMREQRPARWGRWYGGTALALLGGAALILAWAIPAGLAGGAEYRNAIFWGQSAGRMVESFAHKAPWWFYAASLPLMLAPWLLWPRWWRGMRGAEVGDSGQRLALAGLLVAFVVFSAISGKRWQYLLPEYLFIALLMARALADAPAPRRWSLAVPALTLALLGAAALGAAPLLVARLELPHAGPALALGGLLALACGAALLLRRPADVRDEVRRIAAATVVATSALLAGVVLAMREPYDMHEVAARLAQFEREGRPVALNVDNHGQWALAGRLRRPLQELPTEQIPAWLAAHPQGRALFVYRREEQLPPGLQVEYTRPYRGAKLAILAQP
ncbi:ArnT family glycosyltransferase [Azohydromonas caseinilytica]|uniref:Glycosyltransferase family 39 protein n=1 Tax=Azohydromonas caseinilytica TaxID=2728836 RepID=A0A848FE91_9BURK|nr:glycosyltransferase family 39 protein [Azohydromonas caseinilytica]NML16593.1 glycosyltransferase family 39 protein [Azohydromonas caseinilytica]